MNASYDVRFSDTRRNKSSKKPSYEVRWKVGGREKSESFGTKALADNWLSDLRQAAKRGEAFDWASGIHAQGQEGTHLVRLPGRLRRDPMASLGGQEPGGHDGRAVQRHARTHQRPAGPTG
ncbi:hypothetical protein [Microbispora sp. NPDC046933]|uniref:hypothetical protein n=1 Tax=Microbispora sp. NPDC046933 TaxID=3155618 RepID=UPI0033EF97CA